MGHRLASGQIKKCAPGLHKPDFSGNKENKEMVFNIFERYPCGTFVCNMELQPNEEITKV